MGIGKSALALCTALKSASHSITDFIQGYNPFGSDTGSG